MSTCNTFDNVACPFCGLACDDLRIAQDEHQLKVLGDLPTFCQSGFANSAQQELDTKPQVDGHPATLEEAIQAACKLIETSQRPLLAGLLLDIQGAQEATRLAVDCGGIVDHANSDAVLRNVSVLQKTGFISATLSEVRARADFIIIIGDRILDNFPRLNERILSGGRPFLNGRKPEFAFIGPWDEKIPGNIKDNVFEVLNTPKDRIHQTVHILNAIANDYPPQDKNSQALQRIYQKITQSSYSCILWDSNDLDYPHAELTIELLSLLLRKLNQNLRCVGVPMGGNGITFNNVCLWQTAHPVRTAYDRDQPIYSPKHHATAQVLADQSADLLIWSAALRALPPPDCQLPTIAITRPDTVINHPVQVYIPVGIPGIDYSGHIFRSDNVTILPLTQLRKTNLTSAAQVLSATPQRLIYQRRAMMLKLSGGIVYDPIRKIDGEVQDIYIQDGKIVETPPADSRFEEYDIRGKIVMAGAIDIHTHIGGGKVNIARCMMTHHDENLMLGSVETGLRYAEMGYTACFEPAMLPANARQAHFEMADTPIVDVGAYALLGNDDFLLHLLAKKASAEEIRNYVAWTIDASQAIAIKVVNPGGINAFKFNQRALDIDETAPHYEITPRRIVQALSRALNELGVPHPLHVHASNLGVSRQLHQHP